MELNYLYGKWKDLTQSAPPGKAEGLWKQLQEAYSEPHRRYHNLRHLYQLFGWYDRYEPEIGNREAVQWAIFYHDAVYRPGRSDNEERSASMAEQALQEMNLPEGIINAVRKFILATKDHHAEKEPGSDLRFFLDFDLGILAAEDGAYREYVAAVRQEYGFLPDGVFNAGRAAFVRKTLQLPAIYFTPPFRELEEKARANLTRELEGSLWHS